MKIPGLIYVNERRGSDHSGNGSLAYPFRTLLFAKEFAARWATEHRNACKIRDTSQELLAEVEKPYEP